MKTKPPRLAPLTRKDFISKKLAPKLSQQLKVRFPVSCIAALAPLSQPLLS